MKAHMLLIIVEAMMTSTPLPSKPEAKEEKKEEKSKDEQQQEEPEEDAILENQLRLAVEVKYLH